MVSLSRAFGLMWIVFLLLASSAAQAQGMGAIAGVGVWFPPPGQDSVEAARAAFEGGTATTVGDASYEFRVSPRRAVWYAILISEEYASMPLTLEMTHPSIRAAALYVPQAQGAPQLVARAGREVPVKNRAAGRFPATFELPGATSSGPRTIYLRVFNAVPARGRFLLQPTAQAADAVARTRQFQGVSLAIALLGALFSSWRAVRLRSAAWTFFSVMYVCAGLTRILISGYAESWLWPALSPVRGQLVTALASCAGSATLLLLRSAFTLEVRAPSYSRALLIVSLACPALGFGALMFELPVQQALTQVVAATAIVMGLSSIFLAWRTANRVALWLLGGFVPVALGAAIMTLGTAGVMPFAPWMLLVMPLASFLEMPMNLRGLYLLERRRTTVRLHRAKVAQGAGPSGETRAAMAERLMQAGSATRHAPSTLMMLRFEGLAPGAATLREMDAVGVESYLDSMLEFAVNSGNLTGRWSFHELPLLRVHQQSTSGVRGLLTALFANALRSDEFGLRPRDVSLRIAYGRFDGRELTVADGLARLSAVLDDPAHAGQRRIEMDLTFRRVIPVSCRPSAFPSPR